MAGRTKAPPRKGRAPAKKGPRRRRLLPVAGLLLLAAIAAVAGLLAWPSAVDPTTVDVGPNVVVSGGLPRQLVDARNSPSIARNPVDPANLVVVHRVDRPNFSAELHWSEDEGATWTATELPLPDGLDRAFAPDAAFAPDGSLYVAYVNLQGAGNVPDNLWVARSDDGGRTLSEPVRVAGELTFQTRIVVDPAGTLHLTYVQATDVAVLQFVGPVEVVAVRSDDGGQTFTDPVRVSDPDRQRVGAAAPAIDDDGNLVVVYQDFTTNIRDYQNLEGPPWEEPAALVFTRSTDGGDSFQPGVVVDDDLLPAKRFLIFLPEFPSLAVGPSGKLVVAWSDARSGDEDVFLRTSTDGATWAEPVRVNDNPPGDGTSQYLPAVDVAPNGRIDVAFLDRRDDPDDHLMETTLAFSTDGGEEFHNVQVSSEASDGRIGATVSEHIDVDFGSRMGITSAAEAAHVVWTDTRLAELPDHGRQDIFTAEVRSLPDPGGSMPASAAGFAVTVAALLGAAWLFRRRA